MEKEGSPTLLGDKRIEDRYGLNPFVVPRLKPKEPARLTRRRMSRRTLCGSTVLGMFGFGASAGGSTPSGAYSSAALSVIPNADGGVYRSAGLSQYSGSIVNRPTFFAFARGAAVMGEAGPEAILPLRRGTDGKLGLWQQVPEGWRCLHRSIILQSATRGRN